MYEGKKDARIWLLYFDLLHGNGCRRMSIFFIGRYRFFVLKGKLKKLLEILILILVEEG